ncbi:Leucine-rich repeat [Trypanosoma melophagium]|uniref:Leucine-rich repeat n=1 Tax=Trypanosoma melophagium TaxID=715481 RepID=UPI003519FDB6|nr:Leucine-rich repeat [Trypanosoma melophagium]
MQSFNELLKLVSKTGTTDVLWSCKKMGDSELETLIAAMEMSPVPVERIDFSGNEITSSGALALSRFIQKSPTIQEVQLQGNKIDDAGARYFFQIFTNPDHPKAFDIDDNLCSKSLVHNLLLLAQCYKYSKDIRRGLLNGEADQLDLTDINHNKVDTRLVPFFVRHVDGLKTLILSGCSLGDAGTAAIGALIKESTIRHVDLSNNDVSDVGLVQFIESADLLNHPTITFLSFAQNIRIGNSAAQALVNTLFEKNDIITTFNLVDTSVTSKVRGIIDHECALNKEPNPLKRAVVAIRTNDPSCTTVNLQWEEGMNKAAFFIAPVLKDNSHLLELNLGNCSVGDKGVELLVEPLKHNSTIRLLALPNNGITSTGAKILFQCLQRHASLEEVNVAGNRINDDAALSIISAIKSNSSLKNVNITNNFIGVDYINEVEGLLIINQSPREIRRLVFEIESNDPSLTEISLAGGTGEEYYNNNSVRLLCQALLLNRTVLSLDLSKNVIGDTGVVFISEMLMTNATLTRLNLSENSITGRGARRLCDALRTNTSLEELNLSNNALYDDGVGAFPDMLKFNDRILSIDLEKTGVSPEMYTKITEAADLNKEPKSLKDTVYRLQGGDQSMTKVDLRRENCSRPLDDQSIGTLCVHLKGRTFVQDLILKGNTIKAEGCKILGKILSREDCGISFLDLSSNPIDDEGLMELVRGLESEKCSLEILFLNETNVTSVGIEFLIKILKTNTSLKDVRTPNGVTAEAFCTMNRELMINKQPKSLKPLLASIDANDDISTVVLRDPKYMFTDSACQLLSASLMNNNHVTFLDLSRNSLTCESMPFLAEALSRCPWIKRVDLSNNRIAERGGRILLNFLQENDHVVSLELEGNSISNDCMSEIAQLLSLNAGSVRLKKILLLHRSGKLTTEMIDLNAKNEAYKLNDDDIRLLCEVLEQSSTIRAVDLGMNNITDIGCEIIADVLRVNHTIEALYLDYNPIGEVGGEALFNALKVNPQLHTLFLEGSNVPEEIWEDILSLLHVNETPLRERINMRGLHLEEVDDETQFKSTDYAVAQEEKLDKDALCLYAEPRRTILLDN